MKMIIIEHIIKKLIKIADNMTDEEFNSIKDQEARAVIGNILSRYEIF